MKRILALLLCICLTFQAFAFSTFANDTDKNYIKFSSDSPFTLRTGTLSKNWDGKLFYSSDALSWTEWDGLTTISSSGNKLYLRGTGNTTISGYTSSSNFNLTWEWVFNGSNIACSGNIEALLDYKTVASGGHPEMADYCFYRLFQGCPLISAPSLPATTLTVSCYGHMFFNCESLTSVPELPAETLARSCYAQMFYGCTSLSAAPELPATTLANSCYSQMFSGCTSITSAPELPATTLADNCYMYLFADCTSLTIPPALPATALAKECYLGLFNGCTSLTTVPFLPATSLADLCYSNIFRYCSSLKVSETKTNEYKYEWSIPSTGLAENEPNQWNRLMLDMTGGTFKGAPSINKTYYVVNKPIFLCHHENAVKQNAIPATCTEKGNSAYWYCADCDKYFSDEACTNEIAKDSWIVNASGHSALKTDAVSASCSTAGNSEYWHCSSCNKYFSDEACTNEIAKDSWIVNASGHSALKTDAVSASCSTTGNSEYWHCSACNKYFSDEACTNEIAKDSWIVNASGHSALKTDAVSASCSTTGNSEYWHCSSCNKYFSDEACTNEIAKDSWIVNASGHSALKTDAVSASCSTAGNSEYWHCSSCNKYFSDEACTNEIAKDSWIINTKSHTVEHFDAIPSTCTDAGNVEYWHCTECKKYFLDEVCVTEASEASLVVEKIEHIDENEDDKCDCCGIDMNNETKCPFRRFLKALVRFIISVYTTIKNAILKIIK